MNNNFTQLGLGTSVIASLGRSNSFSKIDNIFNTAIDLNIKTIDTSDTYGSGDAERMVGKIIKNRRNETFIVSKVGYPYVSLPAILSPFNQIGKKILQGFRVNKCFKKENLKINELLFLLGNMWFCITIHVILMKSIGVA